MAADHYRAAPLADPDSFAEGAPWELFSDLRDNEPVAWTPEPDGGSGFWSVMRHADITQVSRDWESFTSTRGVSLEDLDDDQLAFRTSMIDMDPPHHTAIRKIVSPEFLPRVVNGFETFLRGIVARTMDEAFDKGTFDFVADVSSHIPVRVLTRMLSAPDSDAIALTAWGDRLVGTQDPEFADALAGSQESEQYRLLPFRSPAALEVFEYGRELQAVRRENPTDDLVSKLVTAKVDGEVLNQHDLDNFFLLLALAGQETTRQAITLAMMTLMDEPAVLQRLQEQPELLQGPALDEFLRWGPPVLHMRRTATRDVELAGAHIKAGDKVAIWFPSGNRDERVIPHADRFDLDRQKVDLLTFGKAGPHYCMGSFLAKLELRVTLEELVARLDSVQVAGPVHRLRSNFVNGIKRLPVTVSTRSGVAA